MTAGFGALLYVVLTVFCTAVYSPLGVSPDDVGLTYGSLIAKTVIAWLVQVLVLAVFGAGATTAIAYRSRATASARAARPRGRCSTAGRRAVLLAPARIRRAARRGPLDGRRVHADRPCPRRRVSAVLVRQDELETWTQALTSDDTPRSPSLNERRAQAGDDGPPIVAGPVQARTTTERRMVSCKTQPPAGRAGVSDARHQPPETANGRSEKRRNRHRRLQKQRGRWSRRKGLRDPAVFWQHRWFASAGSAASVPSDCELAYRGPIAFFLVTVLLFGLCSCQ